MLNNTNTSCWKHKRAVTIVRCVRTLGFYVKDLVGHVTLEAVNIVERLEKERERREGRKEERKRKERGRKGKDMMATFMKGKRARRE